MRRATTASVLLVEDNSDLRELLRTALVAWGCDVLLAEDGRVGLGIINDHAGAIDVALVDRNLPFVSGLRLVKALKRQRPETRCLMMSGYDQTPRGGEMPSICRFIQKPFALRELRTVIEEMLLEDGRKM